MTQINKPLTWEHIPEAVRAITINQYPSAPDASYEIRRWIYDDRMNLANEIMEAMKPELEKAFAQGRNYGIEEERSPGYDWGYKMKTADFETWYSKTYNI